MEISQKSTLAKLLATENITLEHKNVPTAYFDLKERKVVLPIFKKEMSADLYDLLIGHEVSHALNTPLDGWHDSASTKGRGYKSFLNVIEDARIERDIKKRFPVTIDRGKVLISRSPIPKKSNSYNSRYPL